MEALEAKRERTEPWLRELAADPARLRSLVAWDWIVEQTAKAIGRHATS